MEAPTKYNSFVNLSKQIFGLLPPRQATKAFYSIAASILLSVLEAMSLAVCLPLLYHLVNPGEEMVSIPWLYNLFPADSVQWSTVLFFVVAIFLLKNVISSWLVFRQLKFVNGLYIFFTERVYQNFYRQPWTTYVSANAADTFRKIRNTSFDFTNYVLNSWLLLVSDLFICLATTVLLAWVDYRIIFIALGLCIPVALFYYVIRKKIILNIDRSFRDLTPKANMVLAQSIDSFAEARIYGKENFFIRHFIHICTTTSQHLTNLKTATTFPSRLLETAGIIFFSIIIIYGKWFPGYRENIFILLGLLSLALYKIIPSLNRILISISQIQSYAYAVSELQVALTPPERTARASANKMKFDQKIELNNICFKYSTTAKEFILNNIDFQINKGDFVVLTGASGTGKSTLLHLLSGLIEDFSGNISVDGKILNVSEMADWQRKISLVPQSPVILQDTVLHNIAFGEEDHRIDPARIQDAVRLALLADAIGLMPMKLKTPIGENGLTLSGGQRQRLILARALYRDPEVLLLDEVTNQLDEENKTRILDNLRSLTQMNKTVILISHDPYVRKFATRVLHLERGAIREVALTELA